MGGEVNAIISKVFGVVVYESEVRIAKLKMAIWQYGDLAYNISVNSGFFCCSCLENSYTGVSGVGDENSEVRILK